MAGVAVAVTLAGCGSEQGSDKAASPPPTSVLSPTPSPTPSTGPGKRLSVEVRTSDKAPPKTWVLQCDPVGGDHPDGAAACQALDKAGTEIFKEIPKDTICTQIYGGPQVAKVTGVWMGKQIDTRFTRLNGCEIKRWDTAGPLLGKL